MAAGAFAADLLAWQPPHSANVDGFAAPLWSHGAEPAALSAGAKTDNQPISQLARARTGALAHRFSDDYYHRVHVIPGTIALGNLLQVETRDIEVWNAHFQAEILSALNGDAVEGIALTEPVTPAYSFGALISQIYQVTVDTIGPATIDGRYIWVFPAEEPDCEITGSRVVLFAFPPNGRQPMLERLEWLTDVLEASDASEQRIQLRGTARQRLEYLCTLEGVDRIRAEVLLFDWQARSFALPLWTDPGTLSAQAAAGAYSLALATATLGFAGARLAILYAGPSNVEAVVVEAVGASSLTLANALINTWPAGTRVFPGRYARLEASQPLDRAGANVGETLMRWRIEDPVEWPEVESAGTYRGAPLLERWPSSNWREPPGHAHLRELRELDGLTGPVYVDDRTGRPAIAEQWLWTESGRASIAALKGWLSARKGRLNGFWAASDLADLTLTTTIASGAAVFDVAWIGYTRFLRQQPGRRDLRFRLRDGTVLYRRITDSEELDADTERLTIDSAPGITIAPEDLLQLSWLTWWRLDADAVELAWHHSTLVETRLRLRGLGNEA